MVARYLHLFIIFPLPTYARFAHRATLVSLLLLSNRFSSSSYLKLQIRSVYFVTQQFSWKNNKNSDIVEVAYATYILCAGVWEEGWKSTQKKLKTIKKDKKNKSARIVFQFVPSTIKIVGCIWVIFRCSASIQLTITRFSLYFYLYLCRWCIKHLLCCLGYCNFFYYFCCCCCS